MRRKYAFVDIADMTMIAREGVTNARTDHREDILQSGKISGQTGWKVEI